jgi:phosphoglycerate dehydrogenase-like enzyme
VKVYDPWLPEDLITKHDCTPASLDELLATSRVIFMFASVTSENEEMIGRREFGLMRQGTAFLLMSRAAVVDFPAMLEAVNSGHIRAATDVFPREPVAADDPVRRVEGLLLSAHRTGGTTDALFEIGRMTLADAELVMRGLPPQMCRRADSSVAARIRSKPVSAT